jgi:hypothetical protein
MAQRKAAAVSMEEALAEKAKERAKALGFSTFSAYVVQLIRSDLVSRGEMTLQEMPPSLPTPQPIPGAEDYPKPPRKPRKPKA